MEVREVGMGLWEQGLGIGFVTAPRGSGWGDLTEGTETEKAGVKREQLLGRGLGDREGWGASRGDIRGARIQEGRDFSLWIP